MVAAIREAGVERPRRIAVLGAGGTAAAALGAARELGRSEANQSTAGAIEVDVVVRTRDRAADLLAAAERLGMRVRLRDWPGTAVLREADLVISTVPAGAADAVAAEWVPRPAQAVFDVLYEPWPTRLAIVADDAGATVVGGLDLLVHQAAGQIALWAGRPAPVDAMRAAGDQALKARASTA
jgi:shikimate dehydrogenase